VPAEGTEEQALHLVRQGLPILTGIDHVAVPGGELRQLIEPVALYPWSIVYRADDRATGVRVMVEAATRLAAEEGWLDVPPGAWLPEPERYDAFRSVHHDVDDPAIGRSPRLHPPSLEKVDSGENCTAEVERDTVLKPVVGDLLVEAWLPARNDVINDA
jgi:hypothetical protein